MRIVYSYQGKDSVFDSETAHVVIGRPKEGIAVDLDLTPDRAVSHPHARVWIEGEQYWVEDLYSLNGTQVNGQEIKGKVRWRLQPGDAIQIGRTVLRVEIPLKTIDEPLAKVGETLDANLPAFTPVEAATTDSARRLALLYELPLLFGTEARFQVGLQKVLERLVKVMPAAARASLLLKDSSTGQLLLKAHLPPGNPVVSLALAHRATERREGFIWRRSEAETAGQEEEVEWGMYAPLLWKGEVLGVVCVDNCETSARFSTDDLQLLLAVAHHAAMAVANQQLQEELRRETVVTTNLLRQFSPKIAERLLHHRGRLRLGGERGEVTILCSDIRGFTNLTKDMEPDDVVETLNDYFGRLIPIIFAHNGTVDKYIGDAILTVFGSPEPDPDQHQKAVLAALEMQAEVKQFNMARKLHERVACEIGIGVHSGEVLHGFIGSDERMEFTVIGDAVNRAARYCDGAHAGEVLISPEVYERVFRSVQVEQTTIATKHEGDFAAYKVVGLRS